MCVPVRCVQKLEQTMKCGDLDAAIPALMGCSKAILENVVFCHQEDSNWPLEDDGAKLKKRFDDIFAASRYVGGGVCGLMRRRRQRVCTP